MFCKLLLRNDRMRPSDGVVFRHFIAIVDRTFDVSVQVLVKQTYHLMTAPVLGWGSNMLTSNEHNGATNQLQFAYLFNSLFSRYQRKHRILYYWSCFMGGSDGIPMSKRRHGYIIDQ